MSDVKELENTESMIQEVYVGKFMAMFPEVSREAAIGSLCEFENGNGEMPEKLQAELPGLAGVWKVQHDAKLKVE